MDLQEQLGFFPSQGELLGFAPQSISNSSLWITALKKESAENGNYPSCPAGMMNDRV